MSIQQSTELIIFVTHVEADDSFLKIWGQVDKNSATCVERMILPLVEQFARSQGCVGSQAASNLRANALCCARFQNEGYYRAKVVSVRQDGMVVLQFIDYGNVEVLPPQEIHLLENIPGSESLQSFPPVAFEFTLMHVLPVNGVWENKIVESIKKILWYNEYKILIHTVVNNHLFIKLWYNNEDFSELMVNKRMAVRATLQEMFRSKCTQQLPIYPQPSKLLISNNCAQMQAMTEMHNYQRTIPPCCAAQQKHMMQSSVQEALVFKSRVLDVPSKHDVFVSCVEDGPHKFSVQLQSTTQILSQLMRDINSHSIEPLQEPPLPGSVCLGRYTRDKVLCRAVVMSVMENKCKLYYVDFGHTEVLPYTDIFQLPPHFISPRVLSIRFTLSGVNELNVTDEMKKYFKQIVSGKLLVLQVRPPEGPPLVQYGDLYDDGKNIKDILRHACPVPVTTAPANTSKFGYAAAKKLAKGAEEMVHVSFVESCRKFFVQLESNTKSLEMIMDSLAEFCATAPSLNFAQLDVGLACAALYDNQWYRAEILDVRNADHVTVLYVDYGNKETVTVTSLRAIREDLIKNLQAQAIRCTLNGWELLPCTQDVQNQFELLILEKRLRLRVAEIHGDNVTVDLYEPEKNESVKSQMLHAIRSSEKKMSNESSPDLQEQADNNFNPIKTIVKVNESESTWRKKSPDSWQQSNNSERSSKYKTWKDESNEEKQHDSRLENKSINYHRFNRDEFASSSNRRSNNRVTESAMDNFKASRVVRSKVCGFVGKNYSSERSWSDKDSDTSSRGGNRRARGGNRGYRKGGQNKHSDSDGSLKAAKPSFDSHHAGGRFKERRGQGHRLSQSKSSSSSDGERRRFNPMRSRSESSKIPPPSNVNPGDVKRCEVVFTNSCGDFFVQLTTDFAALDAVMENIATVYENDADGMKETDIIEGSYCVARYSEDQRWYRGLIKSVADKNAVVQFVDYGNTETVPFEKIKSIQRQFLQLPVQAIRCKLLGVKDDESSNAKRFEDSVAGKTLEVEFVSEENSVYVVLLKTESGNLINEQFCDAVDLMKAKQAIKDDKKSSAADARNSIQPDYVSPDFDWNVAAYANETRKPVIITWFTNPNNFYCQILDNESEFRAMMNEMQKIYAGREPINDRLRIGSPVIAIFAEDGALYRAEIVELNKFDGHLVQYVDFGNSAVVSARKIYPVEKKFTRLPRQAVQCSLRDVAAKDKEKGWSKVDTREIDACFNADKYECVFHETRDDKYAISLVDDGKNVADCLVERNLAVMVDRDDGRREVAVEDNSAAMAICDVEKVDINLLNGQTIRVKVSSFENAGKFYVQLPSAIECENMINAYMAEKNPEVMQRLSDHEICLGTGCLVYSNGVWRRAAVSIGSRSTSSGFHVKFIDTGAFDEIHSDSVIALPGELSVMQNQAVECSLATVANVSDASLKETVEGKQVIVYVDEVDNNRLLVKLYDTKGRSLTQSTEDSPDLVSPICPMPILTSTHKVLVSFADHSSSVWLQRTADHALDRSLTEALDRRYSGTVNLIEPKDNLICAVKSSDGHWYRAQVLNQTGTNGVCVKFIDYGNNEQVSRDAITSLDSSFFVPHRLAVNVSLPVTLNGTLNEQLNVLQNYLSNRELTGVFRNDEKKWIVELLCDGEKISDKFRALNLVSADDTGPLFVHKMAIGPMYDVYVSHIDSPSQFWLQRVDDAADLSRKQEELQSEAPSFPQLDRILDEGSLCAAVYTIDNLWYRAEVIDADEDITTVRFVDYGNTDIVDNKIGNVRLIPDAWRSLPEYAVKCRLDIIPMDSEDWPASTCERFEGLITSVESLQATIIADSSVPKRVDLLINGKSVSETLVEEKHAIKVHTEEELIDEIVDLELDPHSAFVSHINSPDEFWVQEEKSVGNLEIMSDRFIMAEMFDKVENVEEGLLCVAKYPEDKCWYRARIISTNDDSTRVIYIDYGNSAVSTEIRAIPADLAEIPPLSRKCRLAVPEGTKEWSEKACEEFATLAADGATIFLLDVLKEGETSLVKLTLDGGNVSDMLARFCESFAPIAEERLPPLGEENSPNVFISRVNSPADFWVQTESSGNELNAMLDKLQTAALLPLCDAEIGTVCAAIFPEDEQWYRARILQRFENGHVEVLYVDYGNVAITDRLRTLPLDLAQIAPLSKRCALQKPDNLNEWSQQAAKTFEELAANGEAMFQLEILDDVCEPVCVKLSFQGTNVVDILSNRQKKMAAREEENGDDYNADVSGFVEDESFAGGDEKEGIEDSVLELTVDEIVQNMKKEEEFEETEDLGESRTENGDAKRNVEDFEAESGKIEDFEAQDGGRGNLGPENDKMEDLEAQNGGRINLGPKNDKMEDIEDQNGGRGNLEPENDKMEDIEDQNGGGGSLGPENDKMEDIEDQNGGRGDLGAENDKMEDIEAENGERFSLEPENDKMEDIEDQNGGRIDFGPENDKMEDIEAENGGRGNLGPENDKMEDIEAENDGGGNLGPEDDKMEDIEAQNGGGGNLGPENDKMEDIEAENGERRNLGLENDKMEDIEAENVGRGDLEARSEKTEDLEAKKSDKRANIESQSDRKANIEAKSDESENIEARNDGKEDINARNIVEANVESRSAEVDENIESKSVESADIESKSEERADIESRNEERADIESRSVESADIESRNEERADIESRSEKRADIESKNVESANIESRNEERADIESRSVESADIESRNEERADIESSSEKRADIESKNVESANIESRNEERADIESRSVESADIESRNEERADIESSSEERADIESRSVESADIESSSEKRANIESRSVESADIESKSVKSANIESKSPKIAEIESKSEERADIESKSPKIAEIGSKSENRADIESKSPKVAEIESKSVESANIESESRKIAEIESKSSETADIESIATKADAEELLSSATKKTTPETIPKASNAKLDSNPSSTGANFNIEEKKEAKDSISSKEDCETRENSETNSNASIDGKNDA